MSITILNFNTVWKFIETRRNYINKYYQENN